MIFRTALVVSAGIALTAQGTVLKRIQASPAASVTQTVGICTVRVDYNRPGAKGRTIWGELVPMGKVWRTGANEATVLTLSHAAKIAGKDVPAGTYSLFTLPNPKTWTWILSKQTGLWGEYDYKPQEDLIRFEVPVREAPMQEWMAFTVDLVGTETARVELRWEKLASSFDITFDVKGIYWKHLEEALAKAKPSEGNVFLTAARYCLQNDVELGKALGWADASIQAGATVSNHEVKARILKKQGKHQEALQSLDKALELAKAKDSKAPKPYVDSLETLKATWSAK